MYGHSYKIKPVQAWNPSAPITATVRHAWLDECAVRTMREKLNLSSNGGDSGSKKCKRRYGGICDGLITRPEEFYRVSKYMYGHRPRKGPYVPVGNYKEMDE
jgi:hypothetical protein